tara:strand:- start:622 stop:1491 length:870 start_codon:yes stop_codon:yes gene_type:complete
MKFFLFNSYWYNRVLKKLKNEGILGVLKSLISFLNKILNVKHTGEFPLKHFFVKKRRLIKKFTKENLDQLDDINIVNIGNYLLNKKLLNNSSIIYSFGVGENLNFEKKVSDLYDCKVYCFDPTSLAINFIKNEKFNKNNIFFEPYGIWIEDGKVKFYEQEINQDGNTGGSITNLFETENYTLLDCYKLSTLMKKNNHSKIDVIKLDIEGACIEVMNNFLKDNILPNQIVAEFEYSETDNIDEKDFVIWSNKVKKIITHLREKDFKCYNLPRYSHIPYSTIEVLFVKKSI